MVLSRTYRLLATTVAMMLLFGGTAPLIQHVCAQFGLFHSHVLEECCHDEEEAPKDVALHEQDAEALPPCHENEPDGPAKESSPSICCAGELHDADITPAVLPKQDVEHPSMAAPITGAVDVPRPSTSPSETTPARAPPAGPDTPLFILHEALLN